MNKLEVDFYGETIDQRIARNSSNFRFEARCVSDLKTLDHVRSAQVCVLSAALALVRHGKKIPISAQLAGRLVVPYCAHPMKTEQRRILVNRAYKPLGTGGGWVDYDLEYRWHVPENLITQLDLYGQEYFFNDGDSPFHGGNRRLAKLIADLIGLISDSGPYPWLPPRATPPQGDDRAP